MTTPTPTPTPATTRADGYGLDAIAAHLEASVAQFTALGQELAQREQASREELSRIRHEGDGTIDRLKLELAGLDPRADAEAAANAAQASRDGWLARVAEAGMRVRKGLRSDLDRNLAALNQAAYAAQEQDLQLEPTLKVDLERRRETFLAEMAALRARIERLDADFVRLCRRVSTQVVVPTPAPVALPDWDTARRLALVRGEIDGAATMAEGIRGNSAYASCRPRGLLFHHTMMALPHLAALALLRWLVPLPEVMVWVAASGIATQGLVLLFTVFQRRLVTRQLARLRVVLYPLPERLARLKEAGSQELDPQGLLHQRIDRILASDRSSRSEALQAEAEAAVASARRREKRLSERVLARFARAAAALSRDAAVRSEDRQAELRAELAREQAATQAHLAERERQWTQERARLEERWRASLAEAQAYAEAVSRRCAERHPAWADPSWQTWTPPTAYATEVPVGSARMGLAELAASCDCKGLPVPAGAVLELPVALGFPSPSLLLVRAGPDGRAAALRLANQVVLRALTSFPAGRLRLTLVDPVGLGDAFAGLMDLADHDDALLGGGILNDTGRIEQGLEDLITHLETVIQKHLRGRYATIDDFNREAGELQEAIHLVVVADFPAGFSERALEQLAVLARSGARCGVHLMVLHDDRKSLPPAFDLAWFQRTGLVLHDLHGRLAIDREVLAAWEFRPEAPPPAELSPRLISMIGRGAHSARRVEVPFAIVAPPNAADGKAAADGTGMWSLSAEAHLSVPIGKRGADRLQNFDLGVGTCQHAIIGGRTGSGKSTLFHVLITSAALWYSPRELEFHLIDFKKGVEFKTFATHHLPHARVIAIESDREFGLSVLRHLDQELVRRGDVFRKVGAQDLAAHRQSGGEHLPRILLLIDEFQEFFTEDDAIARDAALLLDRFVRQGRAFGLHVVLGSQTLGGSYSLAKSSLGQMGVRVVLPCNEADAHLLLHEDNDASRLLSRPGDAIYNDRAGLAEGNSPFQVCWLNEEQEAVCLDRIAERARADGWKPARAPVIFEGNGPSRIEDEAELAALLDRPAAPGDARLRASIGQSSSLKGPAEVDFPAAAAGNLLIIGQNREAAAATCGAIILGLAARHPPGAVRFLALDGEDQDSPFATLHGQLAQRLPHGPVRHEARDAATLLGELGAILEKRQDGSQADRSPILLTVFALQRLRQLRPDDDLAFSADAGGSPSERFAKLLANGPEYGIHAVVWCDSLASAQRGLGRKSLHDFDARILFQMSGADSTELIDDDGASRLGLHTALLSAQGEGRREKFRPFSLPDPAFLARVGEALRKRFTGK